MSLPCDVEADTPFSQHPRLNGSYSMASGGTDIAPRYNPFERFKDERTRLDTFINWPSTAPVRKEDLAREGFIYMKIRDKTQCVFCRGILSDWAEGDVVKDEHRRYCPECPFAFGYECGNIPINPSTSTTYRTTRTLPVQGQNHFQHTIHIVPSSGDTTPNNIGGNLVSISPCIQETNTLDSLHYQDRLPTLPASQPSGNNSSSSESPRYPAWSNEQLRLRSFKGWPTQMKQLPRELASAGLVYLGSGDRCKCYWCGGELYEWEEEDDPWEEHAKWFSTCRHVINMKGQDYIQLVKDRQNGVITDSDIFSKPHVLAVLQSGYTKEQVQEVLNRFGSSLINARAIVEAIEKTRRERQEFITRNNMANQGVDTVSREVPMPQDDDVVMGEPESSPAPQQATSSAETKPKAVVAPSCSGSSVTLQPSKATANTSKAASSCFGEVKGTGKPTDESHQESLESLKDKTLCKICLDNPLSTAFLPCFHLSTCDDCSRNMTHCPICREKIQQKQKVYWS